MKLSKKLLSLLLCAIMVLGSVAVGGDGFAEALEAISIKASAEESGIYTYTVSNGKATITDCDPSASGDITIPSTLGGYPVTSIGYWAFGYCESLTSITIGNGVTSIGDYAFYNCTGLISVTIPDSITSIGNYAFEDCTGLTSVTIPSSVTSIGSYAFRDCTGLTSITIDKNNKYYSSDEYGVLFNKDKTELIQYPTGNERKSYSIPDSVTSIGNYAFAGCDSLTNITIPNSVTSIGRDAFYRCTSLTSINIPKNVVKINSGSFSNCSKLKNITWGSSLKYISDRAFSKCDSLVELAVPEGVEVIEQAAFSCCNKLSTVYIPSTTINIGEEAHIVDGAMNGGVFAGCTNLQSIIVNEKNPSYSSVDGVLFDKNVTCLIEYPSGKIGEYIIPDGVLSVEKFAFYENDNLISITIPSSVTSIGYCAFCGCTGLTCITIPSSVTHISSLAFAGCDSLTSAAIPDSITNISDIFQSCSGLTSVIIPASVTYINSSAFSGVSDDFVILGYSGTYAQDYAEKNDFIFVPIDNTPYATIHCPAVTDNAEFTAYGIANINTDVAVYDGDKLLGTVKSDSSGRWSGDFSLENPANMSVHNITAKVTVNDKTAEDAQELKYNKEAVYPTEMTLSNGGTSVNCLEVRNRNFIFNPNNTFKFKIKLNKNVDSLAVVSTKGKEVKKINAVYNKSTGYWTADGYFDNSNHSYIPGKLKLEINSGTSLETELANITFLVDPSGYVYEAVKSNRVEGASAIITYKDGENAIPWDANRYEQDNPQTTDFLGAYHWDVPEGEWRVKVVKSGYEASYSEWMTVPPEYTEVAISLVTTESPEVENIEFDDEKITITFSQYMDISTINSENIKIKADGKDTGFTVTAVDKEVSGTDNSVYYAKTFEVKPSTAAEKYSVEIDNIKNYAGISIYDKYTTEIEGGEESNPTANAKLNVAGAQTINFRSIVTITATATDVSEDYKLVLYVNGTKVAEGDNKSVSYEYGELKSDLNYSVKVIDANGKVQKDSSGNDVAKDGGKITCNAGFFKKLIAFFKGLFKSLPKVEVKP